ncbi:MAG: penicillin-binding transpeptidase domain-containing protein, partial [Fidelibacterota bacterium]
MLRSEITVPVARRNVFYGAVAFLFLVLLGKLYYLEIYQYEKYRELADFNRIRMVTTYAPRGRILDRKGRILAANQSVYTISVIRNELVDEEVEIDLIGRYLGTPPGELRANLDKYFRGPFLPARIARDVPVEKLGHLEEHRHELPGVIYSDFPVRFYPELVRAHGSHVLGYLREISRDELNHTGGSGYDPGDFVGAQGIEKRYESRLTGSKGVVYQQVDALGREWGPVKEREPIPAVPGEDIFLTLDADLQAYAEHLLGERTGAVVVLNAHTGEVLALVSKPDYLLEDFAGFMKAETWNRYATDESKPLLNRVVQGRYPPGSAMKLIAAMAALDNNLVDPDWTVECTGTYRFGDRDFSCWKEEGHGSV